MTKNFSSLSSYKSVSLFSGDYAWIRNNETEYSVLTDELPSDWAKSVDRATVKVAVRFADEMTGEEMAGYLSGIYAEYSDAAHAAKTANAVADNSRFFSQDETKEDF